MEEEKMDRTYDLQKILLTPSQFAQKGLFYPSQDLIDGLRDQPVLCIGAGGLGCEILKNLALSGMKNIHVIDLDTIDLTNLNRQFLFRKEDVSKPKAEVAAKFIMNRIANTKVTFYVDKIQNKPRDFYDQFPVIIGGLDNIEARRWINEVVCSLVQRDMQGNPIPETLHFFVDGGTEGFNGQARVIKPYISACFECTIDQLTKQTQYQMCTIANTPRLPEHCIAYVYEVMWKEQFANKIFDKDSYDDLHWVYKQALQRAEVFGIQGVTYNLTMGVVKNIIPAVASTNAIIAASCVNETLKILTGLGQVMDNYFTWYGQAEGVNSDILCQEKQQNCKVCGVPQLFLDFNGNLNPIELLQIINSKYQLSRPELVTDRNKIIITSIPGIENDHDYKKFLTLFELIEKGLIQKNGKLIVIDKNLPTGLEVIFKQN